LPSIPIMVTLPLASWLKSRMSGASDRHGGHHCAQKFTIIGPRSPPSRRVDPPPRQVSSTSGSPPWTAGKEVDAGQSGIPAARRSATRSTGDGLAVADTADSTGGPVATGASDPVCVQPASAATTSTTRIRFVTAAPSNKVAAFTGDVSPTPKDGQSPATGHTPQAGFRAWQHRRPCQITRWDSTVHDAGSNSDATSDSTTTGSSESVHPNRRLSRSTCVSVVIPGTPNASPKDDVGRLASHTRQRDEIGHAARHLTA